MADVGSVVMSAGTKRGREDDEDGVSQTVGLFSKKVRQTVDATGEPTPWHVDSVINTPTASSQKPKYDSDDQSSMVSEPGSPQTMAASYSSDDMELDLGDATFSQSPETSFSLSSGKSRFGSSPWRERVRSRDRVATPFAQSTRSGTHPLQIHTGPRQHIRRRHPQEHVSDHLEVPSPINEDEAQTPPSAAEAAGSQLSMLSVKDMEIEPAAEIPSITVDPARSLQLDGAADQQSLGLDAIASAHNGILGRKQRLRSGAQSNGSVSPVRRATDDSAMSGMGLGALGTKRGFSMGYRADCEKCRNRVPGHMNHFVL